MESVWLFVSFSKYIDFWKISSTVTFQKMRFFLLCKLIQKKSHIMEKIYMFDPFIVKIWTKKSHILESDCNWTKLTHGWTESAVNQLLLMMMMLTIDAHSRKLNLEKSLLFLNVENNQFKTCFIRGDTPIGHHSTTGPDVRPYSPSKQSDVLGNFEPVIFLQYWTKNLQNL